MPPTIKRSAAIIFAICAVPRLLALLMFSHAPSTAFGELASSLLSTGRLGYDGNATTYLEPLYPLFLAGARLITAESPTLVLLLQIAIGSLGGVLLYITGLAAREPTGRIRGGHTIRCVPLPRAPVRRAACDYPLDDSRDRGDASAFANRAMAPRHRDGSSLRPSAADTRIVGSIRGRRRSLARVGGARSTRDRDGRHLPADGGTLDDQEHVR